MDSYFEFETLVGELFDGRYKIRDLLGEGGQAAVMRAWDKQERRAVALKILKPGRKEFSASFKRFEREAFALMKLTGPNCLKSYGLGIDTDFDLHYMAMELVEGQPLDLFIDFPLTERQVMYIAHGIALGLSDAHQHGIFHRDLKPENVILMPQGSERCHRPVLIDFGIAKFSEGYEMTWITATDKVVGTVHYMSPEQAQGLALDARTDVYSLGVLIYELLSGVPPFDGNPIRILQAHLMEPVPPLAPKESIRVGPQLNEVVEICLRKDREERYLAGDTLSDALERAQEVISSQSPPVATCLCLSPDGHQLGIGFESGEVEVRSMEDGSRLDRFKPGKLSILALAWLEEGQRMAAVDKTGVVTLWSAPGQWSREDGHLKEAGEIEVTSMDATTTGSRIALGSQDGRVRLLKPGVDKPVAELRCHRQPVSALSIDAVGDRLFSGGQDGAALVWDLETLDIVNRFGVNSAVTAIGLELDVGLVAIGTIKGRITIGRLDGVRRPMTFFAHAAQVSSITFIENNERSFDIITSGYDGELRQWSADSGDSRPSAGVHPEGILGAAVAPDGAMLALSDALVMYWKDNFFNSSLNAPDRVICSRYPSGWLEDWVKA